MSRRDTIIIAVLLNAGVLAILFMLAVNDNDEIQSLSMPAIPIVKTAPSRVENTQIALAKPPAEDFIDINIDEVDAFNSDDSEVPLEQYNFVENDSNEIKKSVVKSSTPPAAKVNNQEVYVEVTVKRGDSLDKLARNNGTTIEAIKKANHLKSDMLNIGQILQIPISKVSVAKVSPTQPADAKKTASDTESQTYYILKTGDSPWKIARQNNMNVDELLRLNHLDEDKARNLKVGDKIRIK